NENDADWEAIIRESVEVKMKVVEADPEEQGERKILNFGHSIGHALESYYLSTGSPISHGQAITYGMKAESKMAVDAGILNMPDFQKIIPLIDRTLPWPAAQIPEASALASWISRDKKNTSNQLSFSLPERLGSCRWDVTGLDPAPAIEWLRQQVSAKSFV
ncbi:MAG TPA: hypothetical protein VJ508_15995, partial [Saprospiraceae bacterium]|nr:hypothetical protein [Saprospiraceae bacterium]